MNHCVLRLAATLTILVALSTQASGQFPTPTRSTVYAPHGVIATSQPLATTAGLRVMQNGGNAIDAAVVAAAVLNLVEPHMTGIGGDMFDLFWSDREKKMVELNASGRFGALMTRVMVLK